MTIAVVVGLPAAGVRVPGVGVRGRTLKKRFPSLAYQSFPQIAASAFIINEPPLVSCSFRMQQTARQGAQSVRGGLVNLGTRTPSRSAC